MLRKSPALTAAAVLSIALGIGANIAVFNLINAVMLKMLPVQRPEQLVLLSWAAPESAEFFHNYSGWGGCPEKTGMASGCSFSYPTFEEIQAQKGVFSGVLAVSGFGAVNVVVGGRAGLEEAEAVSGGYFSTLGVQPALGRPITLEDNRPGAAPVAVISHSLWMRRFRGDASVLGKVININGASFTTVGVAPARFFGLQQGVPRELWIPLAALPGTGSFIDAAKFQKRDDWWVVILGRLKTGVSERQARASLDVIFHQNLTAAEISRLKPRQVPHIELSSAGKGLETVRQFYAEPLFILMAVVSLVLLIACANVANLLLARAAGRQKEIAIRLSLGAGRRRLVRQLLTEGLLLALFGGGVGILVARWGSDLLLALVNAGPVRLSLDVRPDFTVLAFAISVSLLTAILFGLAPALRGTRVDLTPALKAGPGPLYHSSRRGLGLGKALVIGQVAISLLLLVGAGLFLRTLVNLQNVNLGFNPRNLLLFGLDLTQSIHKGQRTAAFYKDLLEQFQALPGVTSASLSQDTLLSGSDMKTGISIDGYTPAPNEDMSVWVLPVGPRFFETMGIPLLLGRGISSADAEGDAKIAVVNDTLARRYFRAQNPLGRQLRLGEGKDTTRIEVVGVVRDAKYDELRQPAPPTLYQPYWLGAKNPSTVHYELRTAAEPNSLLPAVRRIVEQQDSTLPLFDVKTQTQQIDEMLFQERLFAKLTSALGLIAMALACVGLYGIMAYAVARRTSEIGIRMALGAARGSILTMVMRETLLLVIAGAAIGIALALATTRLVAGMLFGLKPTDPATLVAAIVALLAVAALAGYLPASRASRLDPLTALRNE